MGEVHAHGGCLVEDRKERFALLAGALEQRRPHPEGLVGRVADAKHPLVAAHRAHAAADLVGQGLEAQAAVGFGEGAGQCVVERLGQEDVDSLLEAAFEQIRVAIKRHQAAGGEPWFQRQVKAIDGIKEEEGAHPFVEVVAGAPEAVEGGALVQQLCQRRGAAKGVQGTIADGRVRGGNDLNEFAGLGGGLWHNRIVSGIG